MPKTTSTPTRSRASTRDCAPVTRSVTGCGRTTDAAAADPAPAGCARLPGCAVADCTVPGCAGLAGRDGAGLAGAVRAGMSSGEGACAFEGTGLLCSVIGWLPCHDVRGRWSYGAEPRPLA